jgi:hypothetical protein
VKPGGVLLRAPRATLVFVLACVFVVRLLTPAGFMPAFDHGRLTVVSCPDAFETPAVMGGHHHHQGAPKTVHQPCPYAAAPALGLPVADLPMLAAFLAVGLALLLGRAFRFLGQHRLRDRPPLRGPPLPA